VNVCHHSAQKFLFSFSPLYKRKDKVPLTISHNKGRKYFGGSQRTFEWKRVEVTAGWRKMYKEELHYFLLVTNCLEIKYKWRDM
jgi:hypothetical protein